MELLLAVHLLFTQGEFHPGQIWQVLGTRGFSDIPAELPLEPRAKGQWSKSCIKPIYILSETLIESWSDPEEQQ